VAGAGEVQGAAQQARKNTDPPERMDPEIARSSRIEIALGILICSVAARYGPEKTVPNLPMWSLRWLVLVE
jgi:hypothetical protein